MTSINRKICGVCSRLLNKMSCEQLESRSSVISLKTLLVPETMLSAIYWYYARTTPMFFSNFELAWTEVNYIFIFCWKLCCLGAFAKLLGKRILSSSCLSVCPYFSLSVLMEKLGFHLAACVKIDGLLKYIDTFPLNWHWAKITHTLHVDLRTFMLTLVRNTSMVTFIVI